MDYRPRTRFYKRIKHNIKTQIATRFEVYQKTEHECGSHRPIHKIEYDDIYILYENVFDMNNGKEITKHKEKFENERIIKIKPESITSDHTRYEDEENRHFYYGFVNKNTHTNMKMELYMSNIYSRLNLNKKPKTININTSTEKLTTTTWIYFNWGQINFC